MSVIKNYPIIRWIVAVLIVLLFLGLSFNALVRAFRNFSEDYHEGIDEGSKTENDGGNKRGNHETRSEDQKQGNVPDHG